MAALTGVWDFLCLSASYLGYVPLAALVVLLLIDLRIRWSNEVPGRPIPPGEQLPRTHQH